MRFVFIFYLFFMLMLMFEFLFLCFHVRKKNVKTNARLVGGQQQKKNQKKTYDKKWNFP